MLTEDEQKILLCIAAAEDAFIALPDHLPDDIPELISITRRMRGIICKPGGGSRGAGLPQAHLAAQMTCRLFPPTQPEWQSRFIDGKLFHAKPGGFLDVTELEALRASHHGWTLVGPVGPTDARPKRKIDGFDIPAGYAFLDLTLGKTVIWDGETYRDPTTAEAV